METTIGTILVSVLLSGCIFLFWLYLRELRENKKKKVLIKSLTTENISLIEKFLEVKAELKLLKPDENNK